MPLSPGTTNLITLVSASMNRSDSPGNVSYDEWVQFVNGSAAELYDLLVSAYGEDYFLSSHQFYLTGSVQSYSLPNDVYKPKGVDLEISSGQWKGCKKFMFSERNQHSGMNGGRTNLRYRTMGSSLYFEPTPGATIQCKLWYVPRMTSLTGSADVLDGVNGWEEYVIIDAARKGALKEETYELANALLIEKQMMTRRIESMAANRDLGEPERVSDIFFGGWNDDDGEW
jgi:hypothetical protein